MQSNIILNLKLTKNILHNGLIELTMNCLIE